MFHHIIYLSKILIVAYYKCHDLQIAANWETMMNNMNIGGTEMGEDDELEDSDDDG